MNGQIRRRRHNVFVGQGLDGEWIGLEEIGDGVWRVWFSFYDLGVLDEPPLRLSLSRGPAGADENCYLCAWHKLLAMSR